MEHRRGLFGGCPLYCTRKANPFLGWVWWFLRDVWPTKSSCLELMFSSLGFTFLSPHDHSRISRFSGTRERQPQSVKMPSIFFSTISFKDNFHFVCFFWMAWVIRWYPTWAVQQLQVCNSSYPKSFRDDGTRLFEVSPHNFLNLPKWYRDFKRRGATRRRMFVFHCFGSRWMGETKPKIQMGCFFHTLPKTDMAMKNPYFQ